MSLARIAARLGLVLLVGLTAGLLYLMVRKADHAYAGRQTAAAGAATEGTLPAAATWRLTLYFDRGAPSPAVLAQGWAAPEPGSGVWSAGQAATLRLPPTPPAAAADVALTVEAFVAPARPFQRVTARAGARTLGEFRITDGGSTTLHLQVPAEARRPDGGLELQLELPDADVPAQRVKGSMDTRRIAIKLRTVTVTG